MINKHIISKKGFSLIEVLTALIVLSILTFPFLNTFTFYVKMNSSVMENYKAAIAAQNTIEHIKSLTLIDIINLASKDHIVSDGFYTTIDINPIINSKGNDSNKYSLVFEQNEDVFICYLMNSDFSSYFGAYEITSNNDFGICFNKVGDMIDIKFSDKTGVVAEENVDFNNDKMELHIYACDFADEIPLSLSFNNFNSDMLEFYCYEDVFCINSIRYAIDGVEAPVKDNSLTAGINEVLFYNLRTEKPPSLLLGVSVDVFDEVDRKALIQKCDFILKSW